jgi:hypothetical protein
VRLNGSLQPADGPVVEVAITEDGGYLLAVKAEDAAGNQSRLERSFIVDLGACSISELQPSTGALVLTAGWSSPTSKAPPPMTRSPAPLTTASSRWASISPARSAQRPSR